MGRALADSEKGWEQLGLDEMTDEQVLEAWHAAKMAQRYAVTEDPSIRMAMKLKAEAAAIRRFGVGGHVEAYRRRFPDDWA